MNNNPDIKQILYTEKEVKDLAIKVAKMIEEKYGNEPVILVGLLKGAYAFVSDIARAMTNPGTMVELMVVSSYQNDTSTGEVKIVLDLKTEPVGKNIILVEDIIDTGRTLSVIKQKMYERGAKNVEVVSMCTKSARREFPIDVDYPSLEVPNEHVVGCGLDYNEVYRFLPFIATMTKEAYKKYKK